MRMQLRGYARSSSVEMIALSPTRSVRLYGTGGVRTRDKRLKRPLLYRLSYRPNRRPRNVRHMTKLFRRDDELKPLPLDVACRKGVFYGAARTASSMVEQLTLNQLVEGSSPSRCTNEQDGVGSRRPRRRLRAPSAGSSSLARGDDERGRSRTRPRRGRRSPRKCGRLPRWSTTTPTRRGWESC